MSCENTGKDADAEFTGTPLPVQSGERQKTSGVKRINTYQHRFYN